MCYFKIIPLLIFFIFLSGCGKSPILNKLEKNANEIKGTILLREQFPNKTNSFDLKWLTPPSLVELSVFEITLQKSLESDQSLHAYIWMPDMGHGSSPIDIKQVSELNYIFSELAFIMPGDWVLHIQILKNNQVIDQWQKPIVL